MQATGYDPAMTADFSDKNPDLGALYGAHLDEIRNLVTKVDQP